MIDGLLANPHVLDAVLSGVGQLAGLGQMDVRELSQTRIPVWAVGVTCLVVGLAGGIWIATKLPSAWIGHEKE